MAATTRCFGRRASSSTLALAAAGASLLGVADTRELLAEAARASSASSRDAAAVREIGARARARWERTRAGTTSGEEGIATKRNARCGGDDH